MISDEQLDRMVGDVAGPAAPPGFASRIVRAHLAARRRRRVAGACGALAAALGLVWIATIGPRSESGRAFAARQQTVRVGAHTVVLERGASIRWVVDRGGTRVTQDAGSAFYRAAAPLTVRTAMADVIVKGTSFSLRIDHNQEISMRTMLPAGVAAGALLTAVVYEGFVIVRNDHGRLELRPGESAAATSGTAPARSQHDPVGALARARTENDDLKRALAAARSAAAGDSHELLAENERLRHRIAEAEDEIALGEDAREQQEGLPQEFPKGLAPRFERENLAQAFAHALEQLGASAKVTDVDCSEFPCIVYGELDGAEMDTMKLAERLKGSPALAAYREDADHSAWMRARHKDDATGAVSDETHFAIGYYPKDEKKDGAIERRIGHRNQTRWEALHEKRPR